MCVVDVEKRDGGVGLGLLMESITLSQDGRARVCVCACVMQTVSHHLREGRDKQSVWVEIRWEQTPGRLADCK